MNLKVTYSKSLEETTSKVFQWNKEYSSMEESDYYSKKVLFINIPYYIFKY